MGGGFVMTIFQKKTNQVETLIAREVAPLAATEDMFVNTTVTGGKAVAVPGELKGYWELHKKYGKLEWSQLFEPVIELCRNGHIVSSYFARILQRKRDDILASPTLSEVYIDPRTDDVYKEGDVIKRDNLADTLEIIKNEGADAIYKNGSVGWTIVADVRKAGGIMTIEDLRQYKVRWEKPVSVRLKDKKTLHTISLPGGGPLIAFILNVLNDYLPNGESVQSIQRIAEAFKFAYAKRTELGDERFVEDALEIVKNLTDHNFAMEIRKKINDFQTYQDNEYYGAHYFSQYDHGTANINIIAPNGDAIAATGSINAL